MKLTSLIILLIYFNEKADSSVDVTHHSEILRKCLEELAHPQYSTTTQFLDEFKNADYYMRSEEVVPCLARCVAHKKGWFDLKAHRWHKQLIVDELGDNMYNYCRLEFNRQFENVCTFAFKGLKCLKQECNAELASLRAHKNLLECLDEKAITLAQLLEYNHFPRNETIPCLFKCFADKSLLYNKENNWIINNWTKSFGPVGDESIDISKCRFNEEHRKNMDICAIMYEDYICWERLNDNVVIAHSYKKALKKFFST